MKKKNDIPAKITVLIIAIFLWSFVMSDVNPEITTEYRNINVNLSNISALDRQGLVVMEPQDVSVNVKVTGKKSDLNRDRFSASNILAQVDLSGYNEGQVKIPVTVSLVDQVSGIRITSVEPREILFTFDKLITKEMPVSIRTTGSLPENYVVGDIISKSKSVLLSGPRTWVNEVNQVLAEVNLNNRTSTTTETVGTLLLDDEGNDVRGVVKEPNVVEITIPIYRTVSLPIELQTEGELPENYTISDISITPSRITVKGNNDIVNLSKIDTKVIDINSLLDRSALEVELELPVGVELLNPDEKVTIIYNIEETMTKEFTMPVSDLNILNLANDLEISEDDLNKLVKVTLTGFKSVLEPMGNQDLGLSIDLNELLEGRHELNIELKEIQGITVDSISPQPLVLNLIKS
ncbi:CdaR family protein [Tissierella sp. Yu-01]|uniref:CdaR family protein n=1 Tax=Tissierella sp. Yu-01 TaxID=3035694 RepID=UPI00240E0ED8|nr:CdaR family protein [Tissierella sp. Yu-01]WFA10310.1 CdaR family protein [Tissierella sp. Yu-01]